MNNKAFSERLNQELDDIGVPQQNDERVAILAKLIKIPRFKAASMLGGAFSPDPTLLQTLANELEVSVAWLKCETDKK